ncbi:MAG: hypothetical protein AB7G13_07125 [Lautropia sp.]
MVERAGQRAERRLQPVAPAFGFARTERAPDQPGFLGTDPAQLLDFVLQPDQFFAITPCDAGSAADQRIAFALLLAELLLQPSQLGPQLVGFVVERFGIGEGFPQPAPDCRIPGRGGAALGGGPFRGAAIQPTPGDDRSDRQAEQDQQGQSDPEAGAAGQRLDQAAHRVDRLGFGSVSAIRPFRAGNCRLSRRTGSKNVCYRISGIALSYANALA